MKSTLAAIAFVGLTGFSQYGFAEDVAVPPPRRVEGSFDPPTAPGRPSIGPAPISPSGIVPSADSFPGRPSRPTRGPGRTTPAGSSVPDTTVPRASAPIPAKPGETKFSLSLKDGTRLIGKPVGLAMIPVGTAFGEAKIPLTVVQSLESVPNGTDVKIHFRNGDVVSGTVRAETMTFETAYGEITIPLAAVVKLRFGTSFESRTAPTNPSATRPVVSGRPSPRSYRSTAPTYAAPPRRDIPDPFGR